jgi:hypothetical protein
MKVIKFPFPILVMVCALAFPALLFAQGDPGGDPDVKVPFDGGLSLLIAAGIGYAGKKAYDKRKRSQEVASAGESKL